MSEQAPGPGWWKASDGNWYPPQSAAGAGYPAPVQQPQKKSGCLKWALIVGGLLILLGIGVVACSALVLNEAAETIDEAMGEASEDDYDAAVTKCEVDQFGIANAEGTITNTSDTAQGFQLTIRFLLPDDVLLSEDPVFVDTLDVGQTGQWSTISLEDPPGSDIRCEIIQVDYTIFDRQDG